MYLHYIGAALGPAYAASGDVHRGIAVLEDTVAHDRRFGVTPDHALIVASLGDTYVMAGRFGDVAVQAEQALPIARAGNEPGHEAYARRLLGEIVRHRPALDVKTAERHYDDALALATELGMRPLIAHCHLGIGRVNRGLGRRRTADEHLARASALYRDMGLSYWLDRAEAQRRS
jgi:tetratricopeptide (TPR) repeat protein